MIDHSENILPFFVTDIPAEECAYFRDGVFQLKLQFVQLLNKVAAGTYILSRENVHGIHRTNALCRQVGLVPIDFAERCWLIKLQYTNTILQCRRKRLMNI